MYATNYDTTFRWKKIDRRWEDERNLHVSDVERTARIQLFVVGVRFRFSCGNNTAKGSWRAGFVTRGPSSQPYLRYTRVAHNEAGCFYMRAFNFALPSPLTRNFLVKSNFDQPTDEYGDVAPWIRNRCSVLTSHFLFTLQIVMVSSFAEFWIVSEKLIYECITCSFFRRSSIVREYIISLLLLFVILKNEYNKLSVRAFAMVNSIRIALFSIELRNSSTGV